MLIGDRRKRKALLDKIFKSRDSLTFQQSQTLIGQVKAKDYDGADKGLRKLLEKEASNV